MSRCLHIQVSVVQSTGLEEVGHQGRLAVRVLDDDPMDVVDVQQCVTQSHKLCLLLRACVGGCDEVDGGQPRYIFCNATSGLTSVWQGDNNLFLTITRKFWS